MSGNDAEELLPVTAFEKVIKTTIRQAYSPVCPERCSDCEACAATAYRADRCAELAVRAAELKAVW